MYYSRGRPGYGTNTIAYVADRFGLDAGTRVLDLGCGTGQLAIPLSGYAGDVVALDPSESMIAAGRQQATTAGVTDIEWIVGSDTEIGPELGPLRLTTIGRAFHWVDQERTLDRLREITEDNGGVAIFDDPEWLTQGQEPWQRAIYTVVDDFLDLPERTVPADIEYENPWDELLAERGFSDVEVVTFDHHREWDLELIVAYVFSLSFVDFEAIGDVEALEADVRERLSEFDSQLFSQKSEVTVISGRV